MFKKLIRFWTLKKKNVTLSIFICHKVQTVDSFTPYIEIEGLFETRTLMIKDCRI